MSLVTSLFLFQLHDTGMLDWSFAAAVVFSIIVIQAREPFAAYVHLGCPPNPCS